VTLRCLLDGLLLRARLVSGWPALLAWDGAEAFRVEAVEAVHYELVSATTEEVLALQRDRYRLLRLAEDFRHEEG
jgi:hypothetical protein